MQQMYYGGDMITMLGEEDYVEAVLVNDGKIIGTGSDEEVLELAEKEGEFEKVNLKGKTLMPAFIDPHSHISIVAQTAFMADLSEAKDFKDIQNVLKKYIKDKNLSKKDSLIGFGYDHNFLTEEAHPTKEILDEVSETNPIFILHASAHMGVVNSAALELAEIDEQTKDPVGGVVGREEDGSEPNGYLEEGAMDLIQGPIFANIEMDFDELIVEAQNEYFKNGITTAQDGASTPDTIQMLEGLANKDLLDLDVIAYPLLSADGRNTLKKHPKIANKYKNRLKIGGYKLLLDGSPQGKSAWLTKPYEGEETYRGYPSYEDEEVKKYIEVALEDNQQLLVHCNGDAAADQLLNLYSEALTESENENKNNLRPIMIHCQTVRNDQLDRMVVLDMLPSIFVAHTYYWGDVHLKNLGEERGRRISPAKSAFDRGLIVNFHQDSPIVKPLMLHTVWCAVNRITRNGVLIGPEERVSVYEALKAVTINAAYAYFEEDIKGTLEEGKLADLVILDKNPLKVNPYAIKDIQVLETIKEGVTVYEKEEEER